MEGNKTENKYEKMDNNTYLKLSHLVLNMLLGFDNRNTTILDAVANLFLPSSPVEALVGTFEIRLLQSRIMKTINNHQVKEITNDGNEDHEEKESSI